MDADLVVRAQRGDRDAYAILATDIAERFLAVARRILRDLDLAAAKLVTVTVPDRLPCGTSQFQLWYDAVRCGSESPCARWVSETGSTIRVGSIDVGGKRVRVEAETYRGSPPEIEAEIDRITGSIDFG